MMMSIISDGGRVQDELISEELRFLYESQARCEQLRLKGLQVRGRVSQGSSAPAGVRAGLWLQPQSH